MGQSTKQYKLSMTPRGGLISPPGYSIAAVDWSGQEAMIGAYYSRDDKMLEIFRAPLKLPDGSKNPQADIHCYLPRTRLQTYYGWKLFNQVKEGDWVYAFDPSDGLVKIQAVTEVVWEWYEGPMYEIYQGPTKQVVTPNHRVLVRSRDNRSYPFSNVLAEDLADKTNQDLFIPLVVPSEDGLTDSVHTTTPLKQGDIRQFYYKGYVGCVAVPSGYVVTSIDGYARTISGNTINAMNCTHPWLFEGVPPEKQVKVAKDHTLIKEKGCARDWAKPLQYGIQYLQGADGLAELHNIPKKRAQRWIENHEKLFPRYHRWVAEEKHLAEVRGWSQTPQGITRMVREDNAKKAGSSPGRSGVNALIQAYGSAMAKRALCRVFQTLDVDNIQVINAVHDNRIGVLSCT